MSERAYERAHQFRFSPVVVATSSRLCFSLPANCRVECLPWSAHPLVFLRLVQYPISNLHDGDTPSGGVHCLAAKYCRNRGRRVAGVLSSSLSAIAVAQLTELSMTCSRRGVFPPRVFQRSRPCTVSKLFASKREVKLPRHRDAKRREDASFASYACVLVLVLVRVPVLEFVFVLVPVLEFVLC